MFCEVSHTIQQTPKTGMKYYALGLQIPDLVFVSGSQTREGYTGHELDPETGDYYAVKRYYLPELAKLARL